MIVTALCGFATVALAQNVAVIEQRQQIYKGFGEATKPIGPMLKGDVPFDATVVKKALSTYVEGTKKLPELFPDDTKTGHDTEALPAIWEKKDEFVGRFKKLGDDAQAAMTTITDQASFAATMPKVVGDCAACHKEFRAKK